MNNVLLLGVTPADFLSANSLLQDNIETANSYFHECPSVSDILHYLLETRNYRLKRNETQPASIVRYRIDHETINSVDIENADSFIIVINESAYVPLSANDNTHMNTLTVDSLSELISFRFLHLSPIIFRYSQSSHDTSSLIHDLQVMKQNMHSRMTRVKCWIGLNEGNFENLDTMINYIEKGKLSDEDVRVFHNILSNEIDYDQVLMNVKNKDDNHYFELLNKWDFNAFDFNTDELLQIGYIIFKPYLKSSQHSENSFKSFLLFVRDCYRIGNPFHNFRHAIDVLQATNNFLNNNKNFRISENQKFSLLLASLGHDIGHPGTTNLFLSNEKTPLSLKYSSSILENFHKFQFFNILLPFLKDKNSIFSIDIDFTELVEIINNSILATDMSKHDDFVKTITDNPIIEENDFKLLSCLLIKCADISNVCRLLNTSCKWGLVLGDEFKQIFLLEKYLKDENKTKENLDDSLLINENFKNKLIKDIDIDQSVKIVPNLSNNQMFFINRFAKEFFYKISISIPELKYLYDQLVENSVFWENQIKENS